MTRHSWTFVRHLVVIVSLISFNPCDCLNFPKESKTIPVSLYCQERYRESPQVSVQEQEQSFEFDNANGDYDYAATEDDLVKYEGYPSYHTLNPTFDLLVDWTLDYADAVDLAGGMTRVSIGVESMISEDFVFVSPDVGPISKDDFISLMNYYQHNGLDFASAIPDLTVSYEGWHQDPHDPWRIWTFARYSGTHTGTAILPGSGLKFSPQKDASEQKRFTTGPELQSFKWTPSKKVVFQTVGYIGDKITGSGQGRGSIHGLLVSMGLPPLYLETTESIRNVQTWFSQFLESDNAPRMQSPYSYLPQWWHERMESEINIQR